MWEQSHSTWVKLRISLWVLGILCVSPWFQTKLFSIKLTDPIMVHLTFEYYVHGVLRNHILANWKTGFQPPGVSHSHTIIARNFYARFRNWKVLYIQMMLAQGSLFSLLMYIHCQHWYLGCQNLRKSNKSWISKQRMCSPSSSKNNTSRSHNKDFIIQKWIESTLPEYISFEVLWQADFRTVLGYLWRQFLRVFWSSWDRYLKGDTWFWKEERYIVRWVNDGCYPYITYSTLWPWVVEKPYQALAVSHA